MYQNYIGQVATVAENCWVLNLNPQSVPVDDYLDLSGVPLDTALMTQTVLYTQSGAPVYTLTDGIWTQADTVSAGDILLFAADGQSNILWCVLVQKAQVQPEQPGDPADPTTPTEPGNPGDATAASEPGTTPGDSATQPGDPGSSMPSGGSGFGGMTGGMGSLGGMTEPEPEFELYGLDMADIAAVTPQDTMTLEITVDEHDINALALGMTAQVRIDALGGEKHTAVITELGNSGENSGGGSKYTVERTMERAENILDGMTATATIVLSTADNVLTIPAAALVEQGNQTVVYTGYDEENEMLLNPVTVTVGRSDGASVEIIDGLSDGQTYYYAYYDTLEISFTPEFGGMGGGFRFG